MADNDNDLQQLWQSIEPEQDPHAEQWAKKAKQQTIKSWLKVLFDIAGNLVIVWAIWISDEKGFSWALQAWLWAALFFSIWLTREFHLIRMSAVKQLLEPTVKHQEYLRKLADSHIRIGNWFKRSNYIVMPTLLMAFAYEHFATGRPFIKDLNDLVFMVVWFAVVAGAVHWYGYYKIKKGRAIQAALEDRPESP